MQAYLDSFLKQSCVLFSYMSLEELLKRRHARKNAQHEAVTKRYAELKQDLDLKGTSWVWRQYVKLEYKANNNGPVIKSIFQTYNWGVALFVQGLTEDDVASRMATVTKIDKIKAQNYSAALGSVIHLGEGYVAFAGFDTFNHHGERSLWFTVPYVGGNIAWNTYRMLKRDGKARPAFGLVSGFVHGIAYAKTMLDGHVRKELWDDASLRARSEGTATWYGFGLNCKDACISVFKKDKKTY
jgi:hypothetical protein